MPALSHRFIASPVGELRLVATDDALVAVHFPDHRRARSFDARPADPHPVLDLAARELAEYFAGARTRFTTPVSLNGSGTDFQREVWVALGTIPFGETRSYRELAAAIGRKSAVRAVGAANALNPVSLLVPCHRVIGADGSLTGYAGGLPAKRWLLAHERRGGRAALAPADGGL